VKPEVTLEEVEVRLRTIAMPPVDAVVAIERGGRVPGELIASILDRPLGFLRLAYRDDSNAVQRPEPVVLHQTAVPCPAGGRVLLVDDVSASGATLRRSFLELAEFSVTTLVLKGTADIVAFPELDTCVTWPWTP
jgi:hypoxanthine phosphoribosyltransferase